MSFAQFFVDTEWTPLFAAKHFGVWPLVNGTFLISAIGISVALPFGLLSAIFLSEIASSRLRSVLKPALEVLAEMDLKGYAVGGLAVGEPQDVMLAMLDVTCPLLPADRPRYLMGVGTPQDILRSVGHGVDMFDCVLPTRSGRNGQAWTWDGPINLKNAKYADDDHPLDETSKCPASRDYTKAYLNHLVRSGEYLGSMLLTWHNVWFYQDLMQRMRDAIAAGSFSVLRDELRRKWLDASD